MTKKASTILTKLKVCITHESFYRRFINTFASEHRTEKTPNGFIRRCDYQRIIRSRVNHQGKQGEIIFSRLPKIQGDRLQLQQLFQNLLSNGLKFHASGRPPAIKESSTNVEYGFWQVLVQDNGIGIAIKNIERIFKPFERLHGKSIYEGTGIGLAICQKIIERHHGTITVKS